MHEAAALSGTDPHADARLAFARASEDASQRSYWRVRTAHGSAVLMDASGMPQVIAPWLDVAARLRAAGLNAPAVLAEDRAQGFLLLSDLGTRTYLAGLDETSAGKLYADALD